MFGFEIIKAIQIRNDDYGLGDWPVGRFHSFDNFDWDEFEVIGNKFENSELLKNN